MKDTTVSSRIPTDVELRRLHRLFWVPFWFTAFLVLVTLTAALTTTGVPGGLVGMLCFLPMPFFFLAVALQTLSNRLRVLESLAQSTRTPSVGDG